MDISRAPSNRGKETNESTSSNCGAGEDATNARRAESGPPNTNTIRETEAVVHRAHHAGKRRDTRDSTKLSYIEHTMHVKDVTPGTQQNCRTLSTPCR